MKVSDITPYLGVFAPIAGALTVLDFILKDEVKRRVCDRIVSFVRLGQRPLSRKFYLFSLITSIVCTLIIVTANGAFQSMLSKHESVWIAAKSSVPLLLAIILKVAFWDYILAIKSALFTASFRHSLSILPPEKQPKGLRFMGSIGLLVFCDLLLSGILTGGFLYYAQHYQALHLEPAVVSSPAVPKSVKAFFDEMNFAAKDAIEKSFYVLNGALLFYFSFGVAWFFDRLKGKVDEVQLQKNIFKIIAAFASVIILISVISFKVADR